MRSRGRASAVASVELGVCAWAHSDGKWPPGQKELPRTSSPFQTQSFWRQNSFLLLWLGMYAMEMFLIWKHVRGGASLKMANSTFRWALALRWAPFPMALLQPPTFTSLLVKGGWEYKAENLQQLTRDLGEAMG